MQFVVAFFAEPQQAVLHLCPFAHSLYHQSNTIGRTHGRMGCAGRKQEHLASLDGHIHSLALVLYTHVDIAFQLIEQLFGFVIVIVLSRIGSTYHHHDEIARLHI